MCSMVSQPLYSRAAQTGAACCGSDDAAPTVLLHAECQDFVHICEEGVGRRTGSSSRIHRAERNTDPRSNKAQTCYVQVTSRGTSDQIVRWTVKCFDWNALLDCSITCLIWIAQLFCGSVTLVPDERASAQAAARVTVCRSCHEWARCHLQVQRHIPPIVSLAQPANCIEHDQQILESMPLQFQCSDPLSGYARAGSTCLLPPPRKSTRQLFLYTDGTVCDLVH